jgi:hypothetical protein
MAQAQEGKDRELAEAWDGADEAAAWDAVEEWVAALQPVLGGTVCAPHAGRERPTNWAHPLMNKGVPNAGPA